VPCDLNFIVVNILENETENIQRQARDGSLCVNDVYTFEEIVEGGSYQGK
jgi:hypothetical protein